MRWLGFVWLASLVCSNLLANIAVVSIPSKFAETAVAARIAEIYGVLMGQEIGFSVAGIDYTGKIKEVILPELSKFMESGNMVDAQLKLAVSDVVATDPQAVEGDLPEVIEGEVVNFASLADFTGLFPAHLEEVSSEALGENISLVRLLAKHGWGKEDKELSWEVLVEIESHGDNHTVLEEPFIARLAASEFLHKTGMAGMGWNGLIWMPGFASEMPAVTKLAGATAPKPHLGVIGSNEKGVTQLKVDKVGLTRFEAGVIAEVEDLPGTILSGLRTVDSEGRLAGLLSTLDNDVEIDGDFIFAVSAIITMEMLIDPLAGYQTLQELIHIAELAKSED